MNHIATQDTQLIPVSKLEISPLNVRKTHSNKAIGEIKASIVSHGLMHNLIVTDAGDGTHPRRGGRQTTDRPPRIAGRRKISRRSRRAVPDRHRGARLRRSAWRRTPSDWPCTPSGSIRGLRGADRPRSFRCGGGGAFRHRRKPGTEAMELGAGRPGADGGIPPATSYRWNA